MMYGVALWEPRAWRLEHKYRCDGVADKSGIDIAISPDCAMFRLLNAKEYSILKKDTVFIARNLRK